MAPSFVLYDKYLGIGKSLGYIGTALTEFVESQVSAEREREREAEAQERAFAERKLEQEEKRLAQEKEFKEKE